MPVKEDVIKMRDQGKTFREIGEIFGISKQRAHQIYKSYKKTMARKKTRYNPNFPHRMNPYYPEEYCGTFAICDKCGEAYEPYCSMEHICKRQNSYPQE